MSYQQTEGHFGNSDELTTIDTITETVDDNTHVHKDYNPFSPIFEGNSYNPHSRTLRTDIWTKFRDTYDVLNGELPNDWSETGGRLAF